MSSWPGPGWQGPPRYMQPDPRAYYQPQPPPPPHGWYNFSANPAPVNPEAYRLTSPSATQLQSPKYPKLNPVLAEDTTLLRYDTKVEPSSAIVPSTFHAHRHELALRNPTTKLRLISRSLPWQIDIPSHKNVTCEDIWNALYKNLQEPIRDSEWGFIIRDKNLRETVESAMKRRCEANRNAERHAKRIDFLGDVTLFRGLEKDDELAKLRCMPGETQWQETWAVKFIS
ncbi:hypothetical protein CVT25_000180 [Psilocybe cyanescens]|uniref:DUF6699 domain-containing protein n=1 Tax=Psilocybe cyanescens TaxID=93625 RepID=A0A409XQA7_PSICY|nr:hypothetical protein CVT25_000180 [Psilocybe cyanescens]